MAVVIVRHGERADYADKAWLPEQREIGGRPWDPPLTAEGLRQARACGARLAKELPALGAPRPTRIFSSPFTRCVQTAAEISEGVGAGMQGGIGVEAALAEDMCEDWYRSWALPDSDGTWRGPRERRGHHVDQNDLQPQAFKAVEDIMYDTSNLHAKVSSKVDLEYKPLHSLCGKGFCWGKFETREQLVERGLNALNVLHRKFPSESIVLVTHGGPLTLMFNALEVEDKKVTVAGYTAVVVLLPNASGGWTAPVVADTSHMHNLASCAPAESWY